MYQQPLLSKQGEVAIRLAKLLLGLKIGDRLPNSQSLREEYEAGIGTIQGAMKFFENNGMLEVVSRGHQGTIIKSIDYISLFHYLDPPWLFGSMPLPYSIRLEGLATGFYRDFEKDEILLKLSYARGSRVRIQELIMKNFDFVVCSRMAAELAQKEYPQLQILCSLGADTYVDKSGIVFSELEKLTIEDGMKIGYDNDSYDQFFLSRLIAKNHDVHFVELKYSEIFAKLESKEIDAYVWARDAIKGSGFEDRYIIPDDLELARTMASCQEAVILVEENHYACNLLNAVLDVKNIQEVQRNVMNNTIRPFY